MIHGQLIAATGGSDGVRDEGLLEKMPYKYKRN